MTCTSMTPPNLNKDGFNEGSSGLGLSLADQLLLQQARAALTAAAPQASSNTLLLEAYIAEEKRRQALMATIPSLMSNPMLPQHGSALRSLISSTLPPPLPAVSSMELNRLLGLGGLGSSASSSMNSSLNNFSSLLSSNSGLTHSRAASLVQPQGLMDPVSSLWMGRAAAAPNVSQLSRAQSEELMLDALEREGKKGRTGTFPQKLHQMLADLEKDDDGNAIASYLPHGRAFVIHKPNEFVKTIMPKYFRMSRFSSFQRQLNLYEFIRITDGPDKGAYYHELFMRGRPILASQIRRMKSKGTSPAAPLSSNNKGDGVVKGSDSVASSIDDNEEVQVESSKK